MHQLSGDQTKKVIGKRTHGNSRRIDVQCDAFCRKQLHGRKFYIRQPNGHAANLVRVKEVLPPDADGVIKIELQSVDSINAYDNYDSDDELMESHPDYLLTIEE